MSQFTRIRENKDFTPRKADSIFRQWATNGIGKIQGLYQTGSTYLHLLKNLDRNLIHIKILL